jgi:hypothetical protein
MAADETASFAIELEDDASGAAKTAAQSLELLRKKLTEDTDALRAMQSAMRNLQGGAAVNIETFRKLRDQITAQKAAVAAGQERYIKLGGSFKDLSKKGGESAQGLKHLLDAAKGTAGPMGGLFERVNLLTKSLGAAGLAGVAVVAVAGLAILAAGIVALIAKLAEFALVSADAARSQSLLLEGLVATNPAWIKNASSAGELEDAIGRVSNSVAISQDKVFGYATELYKAGLRGGELEEALDAASISASVLGDTAASSFIDSAKGVKELGGSVSNLAAQVKGKLGPTAAAQMLALSTQTAKFHEHLSGLFEGVAIEKFLGALHDVLSVFDQTTITGKALKTLVETIFNPIFAAAETLGPVLKAFFQGMVIGALLVTIAVLKIRNAIRDAFGDESKSSIDYIKLATDAGVIAIGFLVGILAVLVGALAAVGAAAYAIVKPFLLAYEFASSIDWGALGTSIVDGIIGGITGAAGRLVDSVKGLGESAINSIKGTLGIGSPSKVFAGIGIDTAAGYAQGVDQGADGVADATASMVSIPSDTPAPQGGAVNNSRSVGDVTIQVVTQSTEPKAIAQEVGRVMADLLEGAAIQSGAPIGESA